MTYKKFNMPVNKNTVNPSARLLEFKALCAIGGVSSRQIQAATGLGIMAVRVCLVRYVQAGHLTRTNEGRNHWVYSLPAEKPAIPDAPPVRSFDKLPPKLPKQHPLIAAWTPVRMPSSHLQGVWT